MDSATKRLRAWRPSYQYTKIESDRLRKQLHSLRRELDHPRRQKARGEFESITAADQRIAILEHRLSALISQDTDWRQRTEGIAQRATELWRRSASIPGDNFARQADQKKRDIDAALGGISAFRDHKKIRERLEQAASRLEVFSSQVRQAEEVMAELPKLSDEILAMDQMGIQQDVSCFQKYQSLVRLVEQIKSETNLNQYAVGHHLLKNAQAAVSSLRHDLKTRQALARVEIGLWLTDNEIARRFSLKDFPENLSPYDEQRWRDLRVEIARLIEDRAAATRSQTPA